MRRVVITGMGAVTPLGNNVEDTWSGIKEGKCGIAPITHYDTTDRKVKVAGEVKDLNTDEATVGSVAVYKFTDAITEAEIQVKGITGATPVTGATIDGNVLKCTPESEGYYAIRYLTEAAVGTTTAVYTYKVVYVKAAQTVTPVP